MLPLLRWKLYVCITKPHAIKTYPRLHATRTVPRQVGVFKTVLRPVVFSKRHMSTRHIRKES